MIPTLIPVPAAAWPPSPAQRAGALINPVLIVIVGR
jgi:hypothetical protein